MNSMLDLLTISLQDAGCFARVIHYDTEKDSGILRVTTDDERVYSVHFTPE